MEQTDHDQPDEEVVYGPPMPGLTGTMKVGPLHIPGRASIWLIYALILLFNVILIGAIVLIALNRADKL